MAFWDKLGSRGNVEDRRSMAPAVGGIGITGVVLLVLFNYLAGGDVGDVINQLENVPIEHSQPLDRKAFEGSDDYEVFASTVLGSNNELWERIFNQNNREYSPPLLVLFRTATESACGSATSAVGPHYCPLDKTIYLDETFFEELMSRFGAQGGDVAEAYVIAHEVGHHAQNELGIMDEMKREQASNPDSVNDLSVKLELQADCFAGLWANSIKEVGVFESDQEIQEAMDAAEAVGDDRIQERVTGYTNSESWTHGSSEQRVEWFNRGYDSGSLSSCNTFN